MKRLLSLVLCGVVLVAVWHIPNIPALRELPPPNNGTILTQDTGTLCLEIYTGTVRSTFTISNPDGISGFNDYHLVNFDQRLLSQSPTALEIEIIARRYVDTRAPYPVDTSALPDDVQDYLLPQPLIQSDDPEIVAKANELVSNATTQVEAMDAIQAWVRGNTAYDYTFSLPNDASSVFRNRRGTCGGFSNLTVALLRASDIPARVYIGCVAKWGWVIGDEGGWHAWIETYLPDVGWVASDPQSTANFVDTSHIFAGFDQCGRTGTVISRTSYRGDDSSFLYNRRTLYVSSWKALQVAHIPAWERHPLRVIPTSPSIVLPVANPIGSLALQVENLSCWGEDWQIRTDASWLNPTVVTGMTAGTALFSINATGMDTGLYSSTMTLSPLTWPELAISRTITVKLWLVGERHRLYLPVVAKLNN